MLQNKWTQLFIGIALLAAGWMAGYLIGSAPGVSGREVLSVVQLEESSPEETVPLNTATKSDLMRLPTLGEAMAERILAYREEHGGFQSLEELKNVSGIGDKIYAQIVPFLTLD